MDFYWIIGSFGAFLLLFTGIGILSSRKKEETTEDYLVASRNVNPWLTALSAVSTNNSGFMFIGLIGFAYMSGLEAFWLMVGWIMGDLVTWGFVHHRVRSRSERVKAASVPMLLATDDDGNVDRVIVVAAGLLTFFFLGGYAAAQLNAGSTTLHTLFGWPSWLGAVLGAIVVVVYCFSGGIRASIWTDAAQSIVMIGAMGLLVGACVLAAGGPTDLFASLHAIDPKLVTWFPTDLEFGFGAYLLGFVAGGMGTIGQPHVLIRFMAIESTDAVKKARNIYFVWYIAFSIAAVLVGLYARVLLPELVADPTSAGAAKAAEHALPALAMKMLSPVLIGVMLAGIFSATMSTADSQILSCSAAVTQDVLPRWSKSYIASKGATISVTLLALVIALTATGGVFSLVLSAWSVLGAALGPILVVRLFGRPLPTPIAAAMMVSGIATVVLWGEAGLSGAVFKLLPGLVVPIAVYAFYAALAPFLSSEDTEAEAFEPAE